MTIEDSRIFYIDNPTAARARCYYQEGSDTGQSPSQLVLTIVFFLCFPELWWDFPRERTLRQDVPKR